MALLLLAAWLAIEPNSAHAAPQPAKGKVLLTLVPQSEAGRSLRANDVALAGSVGERQKVTLGITSISTGSKVRLRTRGGFGISQGRDRVQVNPVSLRLEGGKAAMIARVGGPRVLLFRAVGDGDIDRDQGTAKLRGGELRLTPAGAAVLERKLGIANLTSGEVGKLRLRALRKGDSTLGQQPGGGQAPGGESGGSNDPYADRCLVPSGASSLPPFQPPGPAAASPTLSNPLPLTGGGADWGVKASFRGYVNGGGGSPSQGTAPITAFDGATINGNGTFHFNGGGQYRRQRNAASDQLVLDGAGTVLFCYPGHYFRIALSDPTVIVDGSNSRIALDVDVNTYGEEHGEHRTDFANIDLDEVRPTYSADGKTITWANVPTTLTADGSAALSGFYAPGTAMDPITITASTDSVPDPYADICSFGAGGATHPRSTTLPGAPAASPALSSPVAVTGGFTDWGLKQSFRSYVQLVPPMGSITAHDGASLNAGGTFRYPTGGGAYVRGASPAQDQAVVKGSGDVVLCKAGHFFRFALSNPTVTIDGTSSRITMDVDAKLYENEYPSVRTDIASLNLSSVTPTYSADGRTITWANVPATLTADGSKALQNQYPAGEALDPITVTITIP